MYHDLEKLSYWSKFAGIVFMILGGFSCLSIIGIPIGVVYIIMGTKLLNASKEAAEFNTTLSVDNHHIFSMITEFKKFFKIMGILFIISLSLLALYILIVVFVVISFSNMGMY